MPARPHPTLPPLTHTAHTRPGPLPQWEALWKNLQKWGRSLARAGLDFGSDTGMAELQDVSEWAPWAGAWGLWARPACQLLRPAAT